MQKSTIKIQIDGDDMKKNNNTRNVEAVTTKVIAPLVSMLTISFSESFVTLSVVEDP